MKYLLDELQNYENDYGDQLAPGAVAKDVSFMANHAEVQAATGKDVHNLTRSMHEKVDGVERKLGSQLGELTRLVTSMAVTLAGAPAQPLTWTPTVAVPPTTTYVGHMAAAVETTPPPRPQCPSLVGSDDGDLRVSCGACNRSVPLPIAGVVIPDIKSGPRAWREAVRQWEEDEPL